jgi:predicted flap endonuclease-1-like 5' DNA nuclease
MNFDGTTIAIIVGALALLVILLMILSRRGKPAVEQDAAPKTVDRKPARAVTPVGMEGDSLADNAAAAVKDVAGEFVGVDAHPQIPIADGPPDNLQTLKGVGPKLVSQLNAAGITRFDQLARLSANEVEMLDARMGAFRGRLTRDRVSEQAAYLARGDRDGYEAVFGKLGSGA